MPGARRPVPLLFLTVLVLVVVGGAILGLALAPGGADLAVHNGVGETLYSSPLVIRQVVHQQVDGRTTAAQANKVTVDLPAPGTPIPPNVEELVNSLLLMRSANGWVHVNGNLYRYEGPLSALAPDVAELRGSGIHYRVLISVRIQGGYLTLVSENVHVAAAGHVQSTVARVHFVKIGSYTPPPLLSS